MAIYYAVLSGISDRWNVGRVVSKTSRVVLFPPDQRLSRRHLGSVPVLVGVTVAPGDSPTAVLARAIAAHPSYLGQYKVEDLLLEVQVEISNNSNTKKKS